MKYLYLLVISAAFFTNCSTTETTTQEPESAEPETEEVERFSPDWYSESVKSETDSLYFAGYAHAVDATEERAKSQAENVAKANLIFEVDRFAEEVRLELVEERGESSYGTSQFIINLRNEVQSLDLSSAEIDFEAKEKDGLQHIFVQMKISRDDVAEQLSGVISTSEFAAP